jgi:hypothetical protein
MRQRKALSGTEDWRRYPNGRKLRGRNCMVGVEMFGRLLFAGSMLAMTQTVGAAPTILGAYYEDNAESPPQCGVAGNSCGVIFSPIPADRAVLITHVSCHLETQHLRTPTLAELVAIPAGSTAPNKRRETLSVEPARVLQTIDYYTVGGDVSFKYLPGTKPAVFAYSFNTTFFLRCRITGQRPAPF